MLNENKINTLKGIVEMDIIYQSQIQIIKFAIKYENYLRL